MMKNAMRLALLSVFAATLAHAEPSSKVAWTPEQLQFVKNGNKAKGKELSAACAACHGELGISQTPNYPSLAGQLATYLYKQLQDYKNGSRPDEIMAPMAAGLSDQDMADLASWFSRLTPPQNKSGKPSLKVAEQLVTKGDGKRTVPSCFVCHGRSGEGEKMDIPVLAGQQTAYLAKTLNDYKSGSRHNDIYGRMRLISEQLSESEIQELAQFYHQMSK